MALQNSDIEQLTIHVAEHVKLHLAEWLGEKSLGKPIPLYEIEMRERIVRVEEELRHQRELMQFGFAQMDKRFEEMIGLSNKRFEQMEK
ncbi:MAG: hypothetical protein HQL78_06190, partial [Magnetococcales bacterium]|nr:hypothetical protein [Magnetococcales bacterium]